MNMPRSNFEVGPLLIIGYGNPLRSDDGVGPKVAETVAKWELPGVRSMVCHQLTPELVVPIAAARQVIFVDAVKDCSSVQSHEVEPARFSQVMTHAMDPAGLLQLTKALYERCPPGLCLTIPAEDFSIGETLSSLCNTGMRIALRRIRLLAMRRCAPKRNKTSAETKKEKRLPTEAWQFSPTSGSVSKGT
jgi:hydrogenase maturation protease